MAGKPDTRRLQGVVLSMVFEPRLKKKRTTTVRLIERNKRCMLAYLNFRLQRIEELRWEVGLHVPPEKMRNLHEEERQYLYLYNAALDKYMRNYSRNSKETLDLTADAYPPEDLNVQIRSIDKYMRNYSRNS